MGGGRYAISVLVSAVGGGLLRPFFLLFAVTVSHLRIDLAGLALSAGFVIGLAFVPIFGRWVDTGARTIPMMTTIFARILGLVLLLAIPGPIGFVMACILQGIGNQVGPVTQGAVVSSLSQGFERDAVLASIRSLGNAGLGAGALLATLAVASGKLGMQWLAVATALAYLISMVLISTVRIPATTLNPRRGQLNEAVLEDKVSLRKLRVMNAANLPFAFCYDVLEVALPAVIVTVIVASPAWSSAIFMGNTVLVIVLQLPAVLWMARRPRRSVFAASGAVLALSYLGFWAAGALHGNAGGLALALVSVLYTLGEILYSAVNTALVIDAAPAHLIGRALASWQLSSGIGRALAPVLITTLLTLGAPALWLTLAVATLAGAVVIRLKAPLDSAAKGAEPSKHDGGKRVAHIDRQLQRVLREREQRAMFENYHGRAARDWHADWR